MFTRVQPSIVRTGAEHLLIEDPDYTFEILEIITHPEYKPPMYYHDIALIRFNYSEEIHQNWQSYVWPDFACLPPEHLINDEDFVYDASRWGQTEALGYGATSFGMWCQC